VSRFDYVTVGHVTVDAIEGGDCRRVGGSAFYSALQAARLGLRALIVTRGEPREVRELLAPYRDELAVEVLPAERTTTLATSGAGAARRQRVLAWAGAIVEPIEVDTAILHIAPVARETPTRWAGRADFVGVTPQGLVRGWSADGEISLRALDPGDLPERYDALVLSEGELRCCEPVLAARGGGVIAVTAGARPVEVRMGDGTSATVPVPTIGGERDDLGAGDVFAAAFFVALSRGMTPIEAAGYGNAAAALRTAGSGPRAIADAARIAKSLAGG
jgi:sugar/nucleoside kinase (ribokinase family)